MREPPAGGFRRRVAPDGRGREDELGVHRFRTFRHRHSSMSSTAQWRPQLLPVAVNRVASDTAAWACGICVTARGRRDTRDECAGGAGRGCLAVKQLAGVASTGSRSVATDTSRSFGIAAAPWQSSRQLWSCSHEDRHRRRRAARRERDRHHELFVSVREDLSRARSSWRPPLRTILRASRSRRKFCRRRPWSCNVLQR